MLSKIERIFEAIIWNSRFFLILASFSTILGAITFILIGSYEILHTITLLFSHAIDGTLHAMIAEGHLTGAFIGAIDNYLISLVMLIFGFGIYEIFISNIDSYTDKHPAAKVLAVKTLENLKDKIAKVIVMVLIVSLFKKAIEFEYKETMDLLILGGSIFLISMSIWFMNQPAPQTKVNKEA